MSAPASAPPVAPSPVPPSLRMDPQERERSLAAAFRQNLGWAVMFGAGENYFSLFAAQIRAPVEFFGYLAGIPNLLGPLAQAASANLLDRVGRRKELVLGAVAVQMACFVPLVVLTFVTPGPAVYAVFLAATTFYFMMGHFATPPWTSLISVLVPSARRADFFARISRATVLVALVAQLAVLGALKGAGESGQAAAWIFAAAFALAGSARLFTLWQIVRMSDPPYEARADSVFSFWQFIRRARESNFVRFVLFTALLYMGTSLSGPFFMPYMIYDLGWPAWRCVAINASASLASCGTLLFWGRFSERFGNKRTLAYTSYAIAGIPLLWLCATDFYFLCAITFLGGIAWAGFGLSSWNYILEAVSPPKRARCVAYFNLVVGAGVGAGALLGGWLSRTLPRDLSCAGQTVHASSNFIYLLVLSALVRLLGGVLFLPLFRELRQVPEFSLRTWFYSVAQVRSPFGFRFGIFTNDEENGAEEEGQ